jgi:hypothetical protein
VISLCGKERVPRAMILLVNKLIEAAVIHVFVRLLSALVFYSFVIKNKTEY